MAKFYKSITEELRTWILQQKIFFTGTAAETGRVNISPKGMDTFKVIGPNQVAWLNLTGSGNETAAHLKLVNRLTIMFCAFEGKPKILRLYGSAHTLHRHDEAWNKYISLFPKNHGARNIFLVNVESLQTSCGFAVPLMDYKKDRDILTDWAEKKEESGIEEYWERKNMQSIDGFPTGIFN